MHWSSIGLGSYSELVTKHFEAGIAMIPQQSSRVFCDDWFQLSRNFKDDVQQKRVPVLRGPRHAALTMSAETRYAAGLHAGVSVLTRCLLVSFNANWSHLRIVTTLILPTY